MRQCKFIRPLLLRTPPDPTSLRPRDISEMIYLGKEFAKLGEQAIYDTIRFYSMSIADYLGEYFEIRPHQGAPVGQRHHRHGARRRTRRARPTCCCITTWATSTARSARGASRAAAWARSRRRWPTAFKSYGGEIVTDAPVERVLVRGGRVTGVASKTATSTTRTSSSPTSIRKRTFLKLFDEKDLARRSSKRAQNFKIRGSSGKLNIALDGLPEFPALGADNPLRFGDMHFLDSLEKMERAYDDWKSGTWSKEPYLDLLIPSMTDPTMAPPGKHFMSVFVQYVPPKIHGRRLDRRGSRRLRRHRDRPDRALQPELQER